MIAFDDDVVIVTGGGRGQGEAEAELLVELGARVVVADVDLPAAAEVADRLPEGRAMSAYLDVGVRATWLELVELVTARFGRLDALINNAGIFVPGPFLEAAPEDFERMIAVNQLGVLHGLQVIGGHLAAHGGGAMVNVASTAGLLPSEGSSLYGATKAAVLNLTKGAALELGPHGVRVNAVLPGGVDTRLMREDRKQFFTTLPLQRLGQPIEIARAAIFLISSASSYCTGESLLVDGGWSLGRTEADVTWRSLPRG